MNEENINKELQAAANINWDENVFLEIDTNYASIFQEEFKGNYPFSGQMLEILHAKFGLENFRPRQREIINAILDGHDCVVLMPTGGGKSLCYQLPAVLSEGVTIVISPLIALIIDQVEKLNALDIRTAHLCSTNSKQETEQIFSKLYLSDPEIDILYVTPEKIMISDETRDMLNSLYKRGKLSRFVMDEVHCLSLWGHDFRRDYKQLCVLLREKYSNIQIACFTATATKQVETDVIVNLKLRNVKKFIQSFNRPNIKYQVIDKDEDMPINDIVWLIRQKFFRESGIIYCLSRRDCARLSVYLNRSGISAKPYHAGLEDKLREQTQKEWMQDQFHVIVATIAFGMGIDKPDVRFVIHNMIPKSLEAYYQESGRAGRDGAIAYSYLFYNYNDVIRTMNLMKNDFTNTETLDGHFDNLEQMVVFANNQVDCRRYLQLLNLGEHFDRQLCIQNRETVCDNCENLTTVQNKIDVTRQAKELAILVRDITRTKNITMNMAMKIYKGSKEKNILMKGFDSYKCYGLGRRMNRLDIHRILTDLIIRNILANHYLTTGEFPIVYIKPGTELQSFLNSSDVKIQIPVANVRSIETECSETQHSLSTDEDAAMVPSVAATQRLIKKIKNLCLTSLREVCDKLARAKNVSRHSILHSSAIKCISETMPINQEELLKIQYVTIAILDKYGVDILKVTIPFRKQIQFLLGRTVSEPLNSDTAGSSSPIKRTFTEAFSSNNNHNNTI